MFQIDVQTYFKEKDNFILSFQPGQSLLQIQAEHDQNTHPERTESKEQTACGRGEKPNPRDAETYPQT